MERYWVHMDPNDTYCAIGMVPIGIVLTGPNFTEYTVVDRLDAHLCPKGSVPITFNANEPVEATFPIFFPSRWMPHSHMPADP